MRKKMTSKQALEELYVDIKHLIKIKDWLEND